MGKYLNRIIEISINDNNKAQCILHKIGDNEWSRTEFIGSLLLIILLPILCYLTINTQWLFLYPLSIFIILSKNIINSISNYIDYRNYLIKNKIINIFGF